MTTSLEVDANRRRRPFAYELPGATRSIVEGCALRSGAARFQFRFAHRDQSQNPLRGRVLSPTRGLTDGAAGLPSLTEDRRKLFFPRARALLPSFLPSWPCKGSAELGGAAVVTSRSLEMRNSGRRDRRHGLNLFLSCDLFLFMLKLGNRGRSRPF